MESFVWRTAQLFFTQTAIEGRKRQRTDQKSFYTITDKYGSTKKQISSHISRENGGFLLVCHFILTWHGWLGWLFVTTEKKIENKRRYYLEASAKEKTIVPLTVGILKCTRVTPWKRRDGASQLITGLITSTMWQQYTPLKMVTTNNS